MVNKKEALIVVGIFFIFLFVSLVSAGQMMALQGNVKNSTGSDLTSGNLTVEIWDSLTGGSLVFNSTDAYENNITSGRYDVMLGEYNALSLDYGRNYYMGIVINSEDLSFDGATRRIFQPSVGMINSSFLNLTTLDLSTINATGNVTTNNWFNGLFNWFIDAASKTYLSFNGTTLSFNETFLNSTIENRGLAAGFNSTYNASYVPYSGATGNVDLGVNNISAGIGTTFGNASRYLSFGIFDLSGAGYGYYSTIKGVSNGAIGNATVIENALAILGNTETTGLSAGQDPTISLTDRNTLAEGEISYNSSLDRMSFAEANLYSFDGDVSIGDNELKLGTPTTNLNITINDFNFSGLIPDTMIEIIQLIGYASEQSTIGAVDLRSLALGRTILLDADINSGDNPEIAFGLINNSIAPNYITSIKSFDFDIATDRYRFDDEVYIDGILNATGDVCTIGGNCLSDVGSGDNSSWNQTLADTLYYGNGDDVNFSTLNVTGASNFGGRWQDGGVTITGGNVFAQTLYVFNITSVAVDNLRINGTISPGAIIWNNTFDLGKTDETWRYGYFGTDVVINGESVKKWMYNMSDGSYNSSYAGSLNNASYLSTYNATYAGYAGDSSPWKYSATAIYNATANVGIGTANPQQKLNVVGDVNITGNFMTGYGAVASGSNSTAMGYKTNASGDYSTAMGYGTNASGDYSTAMGRSTIASNIHSTAMGLWTVASGNEATAMGYATTASGSYSVAMGCATTASAIGSTAIGYYTQASAIGSTAIGYYTQASGDYSTALGRGIKASGEYTFAISLNNSDGADCSQNESMCIMGGKVGIGTLTPGAKLEVDGDINVTAGNDVCIEGGGNCLSEMTAGTGSSPWESSATAIYNTTANVGIGTVNPQQKLNVVGDANITGRFMAGEGSIASGSNSTAIGYYTTASGQSSIAMGRETTASGQSSIAMGYDSVASGDPSFAIGYGVNASGYNSVAMGRDTSTSGQSSVAMGEDTIASGEWSVAMGRDTNASGFYSIAMGYDSVASDFASIAMGGSTTASNNYAIAMGLYSNASAYASVAMGGYAKASGSFGTAMGYNTTASGESSFAIGRETTASGLYSTAFGFNSNAVHTGSFAAGYNTTASGEFSGISANVAMGYHTRALDAYSVAMGEYTTASGIASVAMGSHVNVVGDYSTGFGSDITVTNLNTLGIGGYLQMFDAAEPPCNSDYDGTIYYSNVTHHHYGCNTTAWYALY